MDRDPASVILPTVRWTEACDEVAQQLEGDDELLVVHDEPSDPVAGRETPAGVRLVAAGPPEGCSGKANAIAVGMETARHDRLVWTDDDFHHPPDWLDRLLEDYTTHGPVTELPIFVGQDPLSVLLEPGFILGGTLGVYTEQYAWGGAVAFDRSDLDEESFLASLRQTVSDDALLGEHLDVTALDRTRRVPAGHDVRTTLERSVRFNKIAYFHDRTTLIGSTLVSLLLVAACVFLPALTVAVTALVAATYALLGAKRWSVLLAVPALVVGVPLTLYALARNTFVWGGRRYAWHDKFDVTVRGADQ